MKAVVLGAVVWVADPRDDKVSHYVLDGGGTYSPEKIGAPKETGIARPSTCTNLHHTPAALPEIPQFRVV